MDEFEKKGERVMDNQGHWTSFSLEVPIVDKLTGVRYSFELEGRGG